MPGSRAELADIPDKYLWDPQEGAREAGKYLPDGWMIVFRRSTPTYLDVDHVTDIVDYAGGRVLSVAYVPPNPTHYASMAAYDEARMQAIHGWLTSLCKGVGMIAMNPPTVTVRALEEPTPASSIGSALAGARSVPVAKTPAAVRVDAGDRLLATLKARRAAERS